MSEADYTSLNVPQVINAAGMLTSLGGCRTRPEARTAMQKAADQFIPFELLQEKTGAFLARILEVPAALVTAGAAPGLTLATAACLVGDDFSLAAQLPARPHKHKIVIQCSHRNPFERAVTLAGATLVQVGDALRTHPTDLASAFDDQTAGMVFFLQAETLDSSLSLADTLEVAHAHGLPVVVDAAAELPPKTNLWKLAQLGADLVVFSGGKDLRGPQASGLMVGREDLIASVLRQSAPHEHVVGRPLKVSKEAILGLVAAVEAYLEEDEAARFAEWELIADYFEDAFNNIPGVVPQRFYPTQPYIQPACIPRVGVILEDTDSLTIPDLKRALWKGQPPIATEIIQGELILNTHTLTLPEAEVIVQRIQQYVR